MKKLLLTAAVLGLAFVALGCEKAGVAAQTAAKAVSITLNEAEAEHAAGALDAAGELAITRAAKDANDAVYEGSDQFTLPSGYYIADGQFRRFTVSGQQGGVNTPTLLQRVNADVNFIGGATDFVSFDGVSLPLS